MTALTVIECNTCHRRNVRCWRTLNVARTILAGQSWTYDGDDTDTCPLCAMNAFLASLDEPETP